MVLLVLFILDRHLRVHQEDRLLRARHGSPHHRAQCLIIANVLYLFIRTNRTINLLSILLNSSRSLSLLTIHHLPLNVLPPSALHSIKCSLPSWATQVPTCLCHLVLQLLHPIYISKDLLVIRNREVTQWPISHIQHLIYPKVP